MALKTSSRVMADRHASRLGGHLGRRPRAARRRPRAPRACGRRGPRARRGRRRRPRPRSRARRTSRAGRRRACAGRAGPRRPAARGRSRRAGRPARASAAGRRPSSALDEVAAARIASSSAFDVPSIVLSITLPVKPSVTTTSASPVGDREALDVADEARMRRGSASWAATTASVPFVGLRAVGQQRDARALDALDRLHEGRAHVRELDEVLGADVDVGAGVEQQERRCRARASAARARAGARRGRA